MKSELVKNCSLRLASRFLGTCAAESLIVNSEYNLLTKAFCKTIENYQIDRI